MLPCVILCGGLATRLRPITETIPKSLIPINGEPFIAHQLRLLKANGIQEVTLCVGHLGKMIEDFAGDGSKFSLKLSYSYDGPELLGTAGAIRRALDLISETFFVLYGDSYLPCEYKAVAASFSSSGKRGLMTIFRNEGQFDGSNVEASNGVILRYDKGRRTPEMLHIDYGLGAFRKSVFEALTPGKPFDLAAVYGNLLTAGDLAGHEVPERFYEIGSPDGIRDLERFLGAEKRL